MFIMQVATIQYYNEHVGWLGKILWPEFAVSLKINQVDNKPLNLRRWKVLEIFTAEKNSFE